jgi:hypothetical protein
LSHSHLAIRHLIRQVEDYAGRRGERKAPAWVVEFVEQAAALFEPFSGVARPGFECCRAEDRWEIALFLGKTEVVGGPNDGHLSPVNFMFDVAALSRLFARVDALRWNAFPDCHVCNEGEMDLSFLVAEGEVKGELVSVQVHAGPPHAAGPALKRYSDGSYVTV